MEFKASLSWCKRMIRRTGLFSLSMDPCPAPPPMTSMRSGGLTRIVWESPQEHMGNANQTPMFFDLPSSVTMNKKGDKSVPVKPTGNERSRVTVMLACLTDWTKLTPHCDFETQGCTQRGSPTWQYDACPRNGLDGGWICGGLVQSCSCFPWEHH